MPGKIERLNAATNLIWLLIIFLGVGLEVAKPDSKLANTLASGGVGAIVGFAVKTASPNSTGQ